MKKIEKKKKFYNERIVNIEHGNFTPLSTSEKWLERNCTKMKFSIRDVVSKYEQIRWKLRIW